MLLVLYMDSFIQLPTPTLGDRHYYLYYVDQNTEIWRCAYYNLGEMEHLHFLSLFSFSFNPIVQIKIMESIFLLKASKYFSYNRQKSQKLEQRPQKEGNQGILVKFPQILHFNGIFCLFIYVNF